MEEVSIGLMTHADLEHADLILKSAFHHRESRRAELMLYLKLQPAGWLLARQGGLSAGMVGAIHYADFAYVGMMAVHEESQRRGIARALMTHLLAGLDREGLPLVLLDASSKGQPLYEKLGFRARDRTFVMQQNGVPPLHGIPPQAQPLRSSDLAELTRFDQEVFGTDRSRVLGALFEAFPGRAFLIRDDRGQVTAYLFAQPNRIGPWVAKGPQEAEILLQAALTLSYEENVSAVVPESNPFAAKLLEGQGFVVVKTNRHMGRGKTPSPIERRLIYGQASLGLG